MRTFVIQVLASLLLSSGWVADFHGQGNKSPAKPDLSGTWAFDRNRSNVGKASTANSEIKISHHDPEFKIARTTNINGQPEPRESTYYTDGRGETNPTTIWLSPSPDPKSPRPAETKSKTKWSGERVVIRSNLRMMAGIHVIEEDLVDEWKLSADGKTLTQTTRHIVRMPSDGSIVVPANRLDDKRVYTLVSK
jgi:hypothetical protein